jgi:ABC-type nitrate/sulfonate/bicarbonate transport system substrate-binding protein
MKTLNVALDWYPNAIHAGLLVAKQAKFYSDAGINVNFISPTEDDYAVYPIEKLASGIVDIACCPSEHYLYYSSNKGCSDLVPLSAFANKDVSAIATTLNIVSPADLDGKRIACYGTFFEVEILTHLIKNAGGEGRFEVVLPGKMELWDTFIRGQADACWMFPCWEGVLNEDLPLNYFSLSDFGIPYGQSPIMVTRYSNLTENAEVYKRFLSASEAGYQLLIDEPESAFSFLKTYPFQSGQTLALFAKGIAHLKPHWFTDGKWGIFDKHLLADWEAWLNRNSLLNSLL